MSRADWRPNTFIPMSTEIKPDFYNYTVDWFTVHIPLWTHLRSLMYAREKFLEVGSFEGRSTCWILNNMLSPYGVIYCIDTWEGSPEIPDALVDESYKRFEHNTAIAKGPDQVIREMRMRSTDGLARLIHEEQHDAFDFIYIDASHLACDVLSDACMAWPLLKPGGLMVFDDYLFQTHKPISERPKVGIDCFMELFNSQLQVISVGFQVVIRKNEQT